MRRLLLSIIAIATLCASCASVHHASRPVRVLFVGNSVIYVGNLPAVLDALATLNKRPVVSDMIVKGGATLTDHVADGSVERALAAERYDFVVLQERGGDVICAFTPTSCRDSETALSALTRLVTIHGAKPIFLGTYQTLPSASTALIESESAATSRLSIDYVPVSGLFQTAVVTAPSAEWLYADHAHPGHDLVLLEATLLYRQIFGTLPRASGFSVHAPMYGPKATFARPSPTSRSVVSQGVSQFHTYTADRVAAVLGIAAGSSR